MASSAGVSERRPSLPWWRLLLVVEIVAVSVVAFYASAWLPTWEATWLDPVAQPARDVFLADVGQFCWSRTPWTWVQFAVPLLGWLTLAGACAWSWRKPPQSRTLALAGLAVAAFVFVGAEIARNLGGCGLMTFP